MFFSLTYNQSSTMYTLSMSQKQFLIFKEQLDYEVVVAEKQLSQEQWLPLHFPYSNVDFQQHPSKKMCVSRLRLKHNIQTYMIFAIQALRHNKFIAFITLWMHISSYQHYNQVCSIGLPLIPHRNTSNSNNILRTYSKTQNKASTIKQHAENMFKNSYFRTYSKYGFHEQTYSKNVLRKQSQRHKVIDSQTQKSQLTRPHKLTKSQTQNLEVTRHQDHTNSKSHNENRIYKYTFID